MAKDTIGRLMTTAPENIRYERALTDEERASAKILAPFFRETRRNWMPVFVRELKPYHFQLIGSPIIVEAVKMAELEEIIILEIDEDPLVEKQIVKYEELLSNKGGSPLPSVDIMPLLRMIENLGKEVNHQTGMLEQIAAHIVTAVPDNTLFINNEESYLRDKLGQVPGMSPKTKTLEEVIKDIVKSQPFDSETDLKELVNKFTTKTGKESAPFKNLKKTYTLDFSVKEK